MKFIIGLLVLTICMSLFFAQPDEDLVFHFGNQTCTIKISKDTNSIASFVCLHDDENTAAAAFPALKQLNPGVSVFEIKQSGKRFLLYEMKNKNYRFDPNRIFSETGIKKTIAALNTRYPNQLSEKIRLFADSLLRIIMPADTMGYIVSTHNNTDNRFSVLTYKNSVNTQDIFISEGEDIDDFYIVTAPDDFNYLKSLNYNVVLQSDDAEDDGSLSVYAQKSRIPFVSIEVQHGKEDKQMEMIRVIYDLIRSRKPGNE